MECGGVCITAKLQIDISSRILRHCDDQSGFDHNSINNSCPLNLLTAVYGN